MHAVSFLALVASAAATGFSDASSFSCPGNSPNHCTPNQAGGYTFGDLPTGPFGSYKDLNFNDWTCGQDSSKRYAPRSSGSGHFIGGVCSSDQSRSPSFSCGAGVDQFTLDTIHVKPEFDCDLEFHYGMPDGSTCKHRDSCSSSGTDVKNSQCGGAKNVTVVYPPQGKPKTTCSIHVSTISFNCHSSTTTTSHRTTSTHSTTTCTDKDHRSTTTTLATSTSTSTSTVAAVSSTSTSAAASSTTTSTSVAAVSSTTSTSSAAAASSTTSSSSAAAVSSSTTSSAAAASSTTTSSVAAASSTTSVSSVTSVTTTITTSYLTTSTIFTTSTQTITSCAAAVTDCPAEQRSTIITVVTVDVSTTVCPVTETQTQVLPATTSSAAPPPPVATAPCPSVVPSCLNTFLFQVDCADNTDSACYCPNEIFVTSIFDCIFAHGETAEIVTEAVIYVQGLCAPYIPQNPGIATGATVTSYVTPTVTVTPSAVYTTVSVDITTVVPCTNANGETISASSTTAVMQTTLTVPQIGFTTNSGGSVGVIPVSTYSTPAATAPAVITAVTTPAPAASVPANTTKSSPTGVVTVNGGGRVGAGFGLGLAALALVAAL